MLRNGGLEVGVAGLQQLYGKGGVIRMHHVTAHDRHHDDVRLIPLAEKLKLHRQPGAAGHQDLEAVLEGYQETKRRPAILTHLRAFHRIAGAVLRLEKLDRDVADTFLRPLMAPPQTCFRDPPSATTRCAI